MPPKRLLLPQRDETTPKPAAKRLPRILCGTQVAAETRGRSKGKGRQEGPNKWKAEKNGFLVFSKVSFTYTRRKNAANRTLR